MREKVTELKNSVKTKTLRSIFSYSFALIISQILMIVYSVIIMRWLGVSNYGILSANYAAVGLASFLINWGINDWLVKSIPSNKDPKKITGDAIRFKAFIGLVWSVGFWLFLPILKSDIYIRDILLLVIIDTWIDSIFNLLIAYMVGAENVNQASWSLIISRFLRVSTIFIVIAIGINKIVPILIVRLVSTSVSLAVVWFFGKPKFDDVLKLDFLYVFTKSIYFNTSEMMNIFNTQIDLNLVVWANQDPKLIGSYAFAVNLISMIITIPMGVSSIVLPGAIKSFISMPKVFLNKMRNFLLIFVLIGIGEIITLLIPANKWIVRIIGGGYDLGAQLFVMMFPLLIIRTLIEIPKIYLIAVGSEKLRLLPQIIAIFIKLLFGIIIVKQFKINDLIHLSIIAELSLLIGLSLSCINRHHKLEFTKKA